MMSLESTGHKFLDSDEHIAYFETCSLFADVLGRLLEQKHDDPKMLAEAAGIQPTTASNYLSGVRIPKDARIVFEMGEYLQLSRSEHQSLFVAWIGNRNIRAYAPYIDELNKINKEYEAGDFCEIAKINLGIFPRTNGYRPFRELLREYMVQKNIQPSVVARSISVTPSAISNWLKRKNSLPNYSDVVRKIGDTLDLTPDEQGTFLCAWIDDRNLQSYKDYIFAAMKAGRGEWAKEILQRTVGFDVCE